MATALLITGTVGVGKTSVADAAGDLFIDAGVPNAVIDLDRLRHCWPAPPDDPFHAALTMRNLSAVAANFLAAGAERLVLAGVIESRAERRRHEEVLGVPLAVCRVHVELPEVHRRLRGRHVHDGGLDWHLARAGELAAVLDEARVEDYTVDGTHGTPGEVAAQVIKGWQG
ncbi:Adenylylsulphate kinase [Nonomuraea solani]|uniref:Adenylylsulphate kinase n=1 Tax=Nonomuraea solani TaxID=1144553 RepID=A0A1H6E3D0_9ACTN|nr:adenylyl-sulfate kinase [Nonomuraea solani]SEG91506.1 Adenylylsulphate kinase [Nonomuraea solani]